MTNGTLSPDGNWLWNGTEWIPAPPTSPPQVIEAAATDIQEIAQQHDISVSELTEAATHFDLNQDGVLDQSELEQAAKSVFTIGTRPSVQPGAELPNYQFQEGAIVSPGTMINPPNPLYSVPDYMGQSQNNRWKIFAVSAVLLILGSTAFWMLAPSLSPLSSVRDSDGDGFSDSDDMFKDDASEWLDSDNDGVGDNTDVYPNDSNESVDSDGDGMGDNADDFPTNPGEKIDSDNDGFGDNSDACPNSSGTSTEDRIGCPDADEDGFSDVVDAFPSDGTEWNDGDGDGVGDNADDCPNTYGTSISDRYGCSDSDSDGYSNGDSDWTVSNGADSFPNDSTQWRDRDNDGYGDNPLGNNPDIFPDDSSEWADADGDGFGDNIDVDDDNDAVLDVNDVNPNRDAALFLNLSLFTVYEQMDVFDSYAEVYFCVYVNTMDQGCVPDQYSYWSLYTGNTYWINTTFFIDLDESIRYHTIQISAWDSDAWEDDRIDISSDPDWSSHIFEFDSVTSLSDASFVADGTLDSTGWDGVLEYSLSPFDNREYRSHDFGWDFDGNWFSLDWNLDYSIYAQSRALPHDIDWTGASSLPDVIDQYAAFAVTDQQYVIDLANQLRTMAIQAGYTSELQIAEFIYAFVGDIQYQLDSIEHGEEEYPKYPIEMLWEQNGDCEDAALLYISLTESIGYDAALMIGDVKSSSDEDWGGHAWAVIHIPNHSGEGWYGTGSKSSTPFYFVEATANIDGVSYIGSNPWYDLQDYGFYDVE